jgi:ABC-type oligopeptide transport system substrate-binding subunit
MKYSNPNFDKFIDDAKKESDATKRLKLYQNAEKLLVAEDFALITIDYQDKHSFFQTYVKGLQMPMFGADWDFTGTYTEGRK